MLNYIKKKYSALFRLNNNTFTFISGIFISAAVNFYTSVSFSDKFSFSCYLYLSIIFMLISSILWLMLAITLQPLQDTFKQTENNLSGIHDLWYQIISNKINELILITNSAIVLSILSFALIRTK